jgi:hypothetical protein
VTATNNFSQNDEAVQAPASSAFAITPHDTEELSAVTRGLYVGGAGNVVVQLASDSATVTFTGVVAGSILPIRARLVASTSTTATNLLGLV